jgi:hypothetical protein
VHAVIHDPFGAGADPELPWVAAALDPPEVERQLTRLPRLARGRSVRLLGAHVTRHKMHRRSVIEYDLVVESAGTPPETRTVIGKIRARHDGKEDFARMDALWSGGFSEDSQDGISVPEPIGFVPAFHMWLQHKVPGRSAGELLDSVGALPERIAEAAYKIHTTGVPTPRQHTVHNELALLETYLADAAEHEPRWSDRIARVLECCRHLAAGIDVVAPATIHRDFHPDQVIVHADRVFVIDFDLYCWGDPALDIGNFLGHLTELSLRAAGHARLFIQCEERILERFVRLAGRNARRAVAAYSTLTLARHIYLSFARPGRRATAGAVLDLCEERLGLASRSSMERASC